MPFLLFYFSFIKDSYLHVEEKKSLAEHSVKSRNDSVLTYIANNSDKLKALHIQSNAVNCFKLTFNKEYWQLAMTRQN